ncbi:MAG: hypothetical protein ACLQPD_27040 [Desulfomonilaceae bacterium]
MKTFVIMVCLVALLFNNLALASIWTPSDEPIITSEGKWGGSCGTGIGKGGGHKHHR